jgi:hypothetical protein
MAFRKASISEDVTEAKKGHREKLHTLTEKYMQDVMDGKAEGIRNAKELVDVLKLDLLIMGEATERTDNNVDEVRVNKLQQYISPDDPAIQHIMDQMLNGLNAMNDGQDINSSKKQQALVEQELAKFTEEEPTNE